MCLGHGKGIEAERRRCAPDERRASRLARSKVTRKEAVSEHTTEKAHTRSRSADKQLIGLGTGGGSVTVCGSLSSLSLPSLAPIMRCPSLHGFVVTQVCNLCIVHLHLFLWFDIFFTFLCFPSFFLFSKVAFPESKSTDGRSLMITTSFDNSIIVTPIKVNVKMLGKRCVPMHTDAFVFITIFSFARFEHAGCVAADFDSCAGGDLFFLFLINNKHLVSYLFYVLRFYFRSSFFFELRERMMSRRTKMATKSTNRCMPCAQ